MAVAALVIVGVWIIVVIVVIAAVVATSAHRDPEGRVTDGGRASVLDLRVGDCLPNGVETGLHRTTDLVDCSQPHRAEVYAVYDLDGDFTSREQIKHIASAGCADRFKAYVGVEPEHSSLSVFYYSPTDETTFDEDPGVSCIAVADAQFSGSLKGSRR